MRTNSGHSTAEKPIMKSRKTVLKPALWCWRNLMWKKLWYRHLFSLFYFLSFLPFAVPCFLLPRCLNRPADRFFRRRVCAVYISQGGGAEDCTGR